MKIERWPKADSPVLSAIAQNESDLYLLSRVIKLGDVVKAQTDRKVQSVDGRQTRRTFTLGVKVASLSYMQQDAELTVTGKTVTINENVPLGATHSIHLLYFKKVTVEKEAWSEEDLQELRRAQDAARNAQKAVIQIGRDGIARFAYVDDEEIMGFQRMHVSIPQKTAFNQGKITQAQTKFFSETVKLLKTKLEGVATVKDLVIFAQGDILDAFKIYVESLTPQPFHGVGLRYEVSKETALSRVVGLIQGDEAFTVFEEFRSRLEQNQRYFVGPDAIQCLQQQPSAFSNVLILKSQQMGADREIVSDFIEKVHKKEIQDIDVRLVSDRSEMGQQLRNFGGIIGLLKYDVYLENVECKEGEEFNAWGAFDEIAE